MCRTVIISVALIAKWLMTVKIVRNAELNGESNESVMKPECSDSTQNCPFTNAIKPGATYKANLEIAKET